MNFEKEQLISITNIAVSKFKELVFDAGNNEMFLKISLELEGSKMYYNIDTVENILSGDKVYDFEGLKVLINEEDEELLKGLKIDYIKDEYGENFTIDNPNIIHNLDDEDGGCCGRGCCC